MFYGGEYFGVDVLIIVDWVYWEVFIFDIWMVIGVVYFVFSVRVSGIVLCINFVGYFVDGVGEVNIVKQEEFCFWILVGDIIDVGGFEVCFCFFSSGMWVMFICFIGVWFNDRVVYIDGFFCVERIYVSRVGVWYQFYVRGFDGFLISDGGIVEYEVFF